MNLIDIGANLSNSQFNNDLDLVLNNAKKNHLTHIILTTVDHNSFFKNIEICEKNKDFTTTTWGLHPHYANHLESFLKTKEQFINHKNKIKAIGEFGLDFFRMISEQYQQEKAMHTFLEISKEENLPLFLHERDAHERFSSILKEHQIENKAIVHCFTGNIQEVKSYLDMDLYIGITGWICDTRRNGDLIKALKFIPLDKLMIETDSPYLKPRNVKSKNIRNEPAYLKYIIEKIAEIKNISIEELSKIIYNNSINFFNLEL